MNKADLITALRIKRLNCKEDRALHTLMVEDVLGIIKEFLLAGHNVTIANFGVFKCHKMHARNARNPKTGEKVFLDPHTKITFKPAPSFKKGIKA